MLKRRSIFKLIAGAACAAAIEITGIKPALPQVATVAVNPEYYAAEYEDMYLWTPDSVFALRLKRGSGNDDTPIDLPIPHAYSAVGSEESLRALPPSIAKIADSRVPRYEFVNGEYIEVPYYIIHS